MADLKAPEVSEAQAGRGKAALDAAKKQLETRPTFDTCIKEFGDKGLAKEVDGRGEVTPVLNIEGRKNVLKLAEMMRPSQKAQSEAAKNRYASMSKVRMRTRDGKVVECYEQHEEHNGRTRGLVKVRRIKGKRHRWINNQWVEA